jgi:chromosome segregation ATPase
MPIKKKKMNKIKKGPIIRSPHQDRIIFLKRQASYYEEKAIQFSERLRGLEAQLQHFEEREMEQHQQIQTLQQSLSEEKDRSTQWSNQLESNTARIHEMEAQIKQQSKLLSKRENTISQYKEKLEKWKKYPDPSKIEDYEQALAEKQKIIEQHVKEISSLTQSLEDLASQAVQANQPLEDK